MRAALILFLAATAMPAQSAPAAPVQPPPTGLPQSAPTPPASPLDPLHFLLGTWIAKTTSGSARPASSGQYTFHTDLNGTVITRSTSADTCVAPQAFDCQHHDLLTIYRDPPDSALRAIYFDNEGHTIHYRLSFPEPDTAVFLSAGPGLQFRLVYHLAQGIMSGKFQFAPAGTGSFRSYLEWAGSHPTSRDATDASFISSIDALRDTTRILLVFAASSSDPQFVRQLSELKGREREAMDRSLIVVPVLDHWSPRDSTLYEANLPFSIDREQQYLRNRFKVSPSSFTVVLLGKDGGEKTRSHTPIGAKALFETVDSMPMRRLEMQGRGKEPQTR